MATASSSLDVGSLLRTWRERRRLTQLEVALDAGISARHLSFVETGRSKPGRAMLLGVTERLAIPYRERNEILLAAGYAPAFPQRSLEDPALSPVRDALDRILAAHEPYPGIAVDRGWNLVAANTSFSTTPRMVFNATSGSVYKIAVDGYSSATGTIAISLSSTVMVSVVATINAVSENSTTPGIFTFTRTGSTANPLTVNFNIYGDAQSGVA